MFLHWVLKHLLCSLFQFPNLGIYSTIPPTTIHRRAVMRVM